MRRDEPLRWRRDRTRMVAVGGLMKSRADWGNRQGNSARCFLVFLNEINDFVRHFESRQPTPLFLSVSTETRTCAAISSRISHPNRIYSAARFGG